MMSPLRSWCCGDRYYNNAQYLLANIPIGHFWASAVAFPCCCCYASQSLGSVTRVTTSWFLVDTHTGGCGCGFGSSSRCCSTSSSSHMKIIILFWLLVTVGYEKRERDREREGTRRQTSLHNDWVWATTFSSVLRLMTAAVSVACPPPGSQWNARPDHWDREREPQFKLKHLMMIKLIHSYL